MGYLKISNESSVGSAIKVRIMASFRKITSERKAVEQLPVRIQMILGGVPLSKRIF